MLKNQHTVKNYATHLIFMKFDILKSIKNSIGKKQVKPAHNAGKKSSNLTENFYRK